MSSAPPAFSLIAFYASSSGSETKFSPAQKDSKRGVGGQTKTNKQKESRYDLFYLHPIVQSAGHFKVEVILSYCALPVFLRG